MHFKASKKQKEVATLFCGLQNTGRKYKKTQLILTAVGLERATEIRRTNDGRDDALIDSATRANYE